MTDESAKPLPAPAGVKEGLTSESTSIDWFDGKREVDVLYVANGRTVALGELVAGKDGVASAYGVWKDGIVTRTVQQVPFRFVSGRWLSSKPMVAETLLSRALTRFLPDPEQARSLRVDDRAVLGLGAPAERTTKDADNWSVAVTGELAVPGLLEQIQLRPDVVSLQDGTLELLERGADATGSDTLTLELKLDSPLDRIPKPAISLDYAVSLLLDEKVDGAWERPSPLWLPSTTGWLRIEQGGQGRSPYRFFSESRNIDVRRWFPALGDSASVRLMLDQSGAKTLTIRESTPGQGATLTLTVKRPALVFVLPGLAVDGADLPVPTLPPGAAAIARAVPLQLVPGHLCDDDAGAWSLAVGAQMILRWKAPGKNGSSNLTHFTRHGNWVLPPAAAVNDVPGVSPLRILVPMLTDEPTLQFRLRAGNGTSAVFIEAPDFNKMSAQATDLGPLASFSANIGTGDAQVKEMWPGGAEDLVAEPAVLRAAYRTLSAGMAVEEGFASFYATRVRRGIPSPEADLASSEVTPEDMTLDRGWAYRPGGKRPEQRYEHSSQWPGGRFGWMDMQFLSPSKVASLVTDTVPGALAWGQMQHKDGQYTPTQWIRLSDDSLIQLTKSPEVSEESAFKALAAKDIVLEPQRLFDDVSQKQWGLGQLSMLESISEGGGKLELRVGDHSIEVTKLRGVNRVVVADAKSRAVTISMAPSLSTVSLNRIYLELERRGGRLVVVRGMLGWSASEVFGWKTKADATFHVTERFERVGGVLQRSVEFNGVLSRQLEKTKQSVDMYFWDTVQKPGSTTLRVICHYKLQQKDYLRSICALQDARLQPDDTLDLSADIVILSKPKKDDSTSLSDPWAPDRRKLYQLRIHSRPANYAFAGFLRIRMAETDAVPGEFIDTKESLRIVPAWDFSERDLVPWFATDSVIPLPERDAWTSAGLLRTEPAKKMTNSTKLNLMLYAFDDEWGPSYAATLIGTPDGDTGLPLWVPSPVQIPQASNPVPAEPAAGGAVVPNTLARLWLFDPGARMIAQWPVSEGADGATTAKQKALQRLWRMGWTREAVLELPSSVDDKVEWVVVDSPLLNRGASLAWFAGALAPQARYPADVLPATRQVPQTSRGNQQSYALQVEFEQDLPPSKAGVSLVRDNGNPGLDKQAPEGLTLRSAGMRVGVRHKIVPYGGMAKGAIATAPLAWPKRQNGALLSLDRGWLSWRLEKVDLTEANLKPLPEGSLQYTAPDSYTELRIAGAVPGLMRQTADDRWLPVGDNEWLPLQASVIILKLTEEPARWRTMSVTLRAQPSGLPPIEEIKTLFPTGSSRLVGVFDHQDQLIAFGEEQAFYTYTAPETPAPAGLSTWTLNCAMELSPQQAATVKRVITIDLDGQTIQSLMPQQL
ncbi:hypothetical protein HU751_005180 [Pseudomonas sp. BW13M1]|uniref:Uncharacterized protein n=1 Tax=Pseudomonas peradeniyensis TaxID=2745488 RepID=A0A923K2I1_9PSED|nr:hypothetical protein [Pseudomonas peradeniyensis]MBV4504233.1 hypothetical protein [Pseudomonas peradeniyensis]